MEDPDRAMRTLRDLDALGIELSIDDFGTGFSSLAYLKKLPVDELKIDRGFVKQMLDDAGDFTIVRSTIELAHNLGLRVVAEGVEDAAVFDALAGIGCDVVQGYFLSKPAPAEILDDCIAKSRWRPINYSPRRDSTTGHSAAAVGLLERLGDVRLASSP